MKYTISILVSLLILIGCTEPQTPRIRVQNLGMNDLTDEKPFYQSGSNIITVDKIVSKYKCKISSIKNGISKEIKTFEVDNSITPTNSVFTTIVNQKGKASINIGCLKNGSSNAYDRIRESVKCVQCTVSPSYANTEIKEEFRIVQLITFFKDLNSGTGGLPGDNKESLIKLTKDFPSVEFFVLEIKK